MQYGGEGEAALLAETVPAQVRERGGTAGKEQQPCHPGEPTRQTFVGGVCTPASPNPQKSQPKQTHTVGGSVLRCVHTAVSSSLPTPRSLNALDSLGVLHVYGCLLPHPHRGESQAEAGLTRLGGCEDRRRGQVRATGLRGEGRGRLRPDSHGWEAAKWGQAREGNGMRPHLASARHYDPPPLPSMTRLRRPLQRPTAVWRSHHPSPLPPQRPCVTSSCHCKDRLLCGALTIPPPPLPQWPCLASACHCKDRLLRCALGPRVHEGGPVAAALAKVGFGRQAPDVVHCRA